MLAYYEPWNANGICFMAGVYPYSDDNLMKVRFFEAMVNSSIYETIGGELQFPIDKKVKRIINIKGNLNGVKSWLNQ